MSYIKSTPFSPQDTTSVFNLKHAELPEQKKHSQDFN